MYCSTLLRVDTIGERDFASLPREILPRENWNHEGDDQCINSDSFGKSDKGTVMLKGAIARRYAEAIFDIARRQNTIDRTLDDVREIARLFAHRKLAFLLREPKIPAQRKETAIRQALTDKVLPTSLNLALLVVQRELVEIMPNIASELEQLVLDYKNQAKAQVTTAKP
jgi:hypothetical protein